MSYPTGLDEFPEERLVAELERRADLRKQGLCDYCGREEFTSPCKFPDRHNPEIDDGDTVDERDAGSYEADR